MNKNKNVNDPSNTPCFDSGHEFRRENTSPKLPAIRDDSSTLEESEMSENIDENLIFTTEEPLRCKTRLINFKGRTQDNYTSANLHEQRT